MSMYINFLEMSSGLELHKKANPRAQYGAALWMDAQGSTQLPQVHWSHNVSSWQFWACSFFLQIDPLRKRITTVNISMFTKRITVTRFLIKNYPQWSWLGLYHILFCIPQHLPQCQDKALQISGKMGAGLNTFGTHRLNGNSLLLALRQQQQTSGHVEFQLWETTEMWVLREMST